MLDDSLEMAKRFRRLGNEVHVDVLADLPHGFLNFSLISKEAKYVSTTFLQCHTSSPQCRASILQCHTSILQIHTNRMSILQHEYSAVTAT